MLAYRTVMYSTCRTKCCAVRLFLLGLCAEATQQAPPIPHCRGQRRQRDLYANGCWGHNVRSIPGKEHEPIGGYTQRSSPALRVITNILLHCQVTNLLIML